MFHHPAFDHRTRRLPHIKYRIEVARYALNNHHRLLQQYELRLKLHIETARGFEQLLEQTAHRYLLRREAEDGFTHRAQRLRKSLDVVVLWHKAIVEMHLRNPEV